jgi:hypothetical protein
MDDAASPPTVSGDLQRWLSRDGEATLGSLIELFGKKSFALVFALLLGLPALPLPTGGATHVFELIAMLLALQLIAGRNRTRGVCLSPTTVASLGGVWTALISVEARSVQG